MTSIRIQSADRAWSADTTEGARVFRIGRDESADIVSTDPSVSRRHAEIRALGEGWEVVDVGSTLGTWVDGQRVDRASLQGTTTIGLGDQGRSFQVTVTVTAPAPPAPAPPAPPPSYGAPAPVFGQPFSPTPPTQPIPTAPPFQPAGPAYTPAYGPADPLLEQTVVTGGLGGFPGFGGPGLLVRRRVGGDLRFPGGVPVRIGRDPGLEVHADDQAVSRLHAVVEPRPDGWWWIDRSTAGSFVDGEQVTSFRIDEPVEISLGHPTAGYEIEVVPVIAAREAAAGIQRRKRRRGLVLAASVVALVLAATGITWGVVSLVGGDDSPEVAGGGGVDTDAERAEALERAKAAAVLLQAVDESGQVLWSGSGSIISEDGLILTNAHVGDPNAEGQGSSEDDPAFLEVSLTTGDDDEPAKATYRANPIVSDGYLDFAVLQINAELDGTKVSPDDLDLPAPLPLGDSDEVRTGDRIRALGYPAIGNVAAQGDRPLTVTEGVVSTFQADPVVGTERGAIDSDVRLGSGNSGGPAINDAGQVIGLNTRVITAASVDAGSITQGSALIVPVNLARAVIDIARKGGDPDYVSPYLDKLPKDPGLPPDAVATSNGWATEEGGKCQGSSSKASPQQLTGVSVKDTVQAEFTLKGVPSGLPLSIDFVTADGTRVDTLSGTWDGDEAATCISAPLTLQAAVPGLTAVLSLGQDGEVAAENPVVFPDIG
ncbi:FHA domain-containing protein [Nocardioides plantarum]|uniref:FHA domain-containing protein n=1 Tax=Nocardioides plantarum TaxID=29299 RepID=A0ABV5KHX0_9ACTN|nr:FHA domain-containing protein [Nocardioides plantarum]